MKHYVYLSIVILVANLILSCRNQATAPDSVQYSYGISNDITSAKKDCTIELIDSCIGINYKAVLEENINFDSNAFKLTVVKGRSKKTLILDLPPGLTSIENCSKDLIILSSACGGPCSSKDFIFVNEDRPNEGYMYCHIAENNEKIISYHVNEDFETIRIRNLKNGKEISLKISPCENDISYPCGINKLKVVKNKLFITFDSPESNPRQKEVSINEIIK